MDLYHSANAAWRQLPWLFSFAWGHSAGDSLQNPQKAALHVSTVWRPLPQISANFTHFPQGGDNEYAEPGHRPGSVHGGIICSLDTRNAKSLGGEATQVGGVR